MNSSYSMAKPHYYFGVCGCCFSSLLIESLLLLAFSSFAWFLLVVWFAVRLLCGLVGAVVVVVVLVRGLRLCLLLPLQF